MAKKNVGIYIEEKLDDELNRLAAKGSRVKKGEVVEAALAMFFDAPDDAKVEWLQHVLSKSLMESVTGGESTTSPKKGKKAG